MNDIESRHTITQIMYHAVAPATGGRDRWDWGTMMFGRLKCAGAAALAMAGATAAAPDPGASIALSRIERGQYEIKVVGSDTPPRSVCVADAVMLLQMQHPGAACARLVAADGPDSTTVNYSCSSGGHGRTVVTITTPRSFDIETQGIAGGAPFDLGYQGRRVGACAARSTASR